MTFPLVYDISVIGEGRIKRALRGVEAETRASASRTDRARVSASRSSATGPAREERARASAAAALDRQRSTALMRHHSQQQRLNARVEADRLRSIKRAEAEEVRAARRVAAARQRTMGSMARGAARGVSNAVGTVGRVAAIGAGVLGGIAATNALDEEVRVRAAASRLANQAKQPGIKGQLAAESANVQGFGREETLGAIEAFVTETGDLTQARALIGSLGQIALATSTDLGELGATAGQAFNVIRDQISDPVQQIKEMQALMGALAEQGAMGAVEMRDLATSFGKLGAGSRDFEGGAPMLLRGMGAFAQLAKARGGADSAADSATAVARLGGDIVKHKEKFKALGVNVKSKSDPTKLRDPMEIIADVLEKTGGDVEKTSGLFGIESRKVFKGLSPVFGEAEKKKKGSGRAAVMAEYKRFAGAETTPESMRERAQSRLADEDKRLQEAAKNFNIAIGTRLIPALTQMIPKFEASIEPLSNFASKLAEAVGWLAENPWKGLGLVVAANVTKEIAAAGIGSLIRTAIEGGAKTGPGGALSVYVTGGIIGFAVGAAAGDALAGTQDRLTDPGLAALKTREELAQSQTDILRGGTGGKLGDVGQLQGRKNALQKMQADLQANAPTTLETAAGGLSSAMGGQSAEGARQASIAALQTAIDALSAALAKGGDLIVKKIDNAGTASNRTNPVLDRGKS